MRVPQSIRLDCGFLLSNWWIKKVVILKIEMMALPNHTCGSISTNLTFIVNERGNNYATNTTEIKL